MIDDVASASGRHATVRLLLHFFNLPFIGMAIILPKNMRFWVVNDLACEILGYSREELTAKSVIEVTDPDDQAATHAALERVLNGESADYVVERRFVRKDGSTVYVTVDVKGFRETDGSIPYVVSTIQDITARKQAELALAESEHRFRSIVEQCVVGLYLAMEDGKLTVVNQRFTEIFGYEAPSELIGRALPSLIMEEDRNFFTDQMQRRFAGEVLRASYNVRALRKDGAPVDLEIYGVLSTYRGRSAAIGVLQDIAERKRADEKIQQHIIQLQTSLMHTVRVATTLSEIRDPYTAGHERRVAEIAAAIGGELGLNDFQVEGLRVAGGLHDVGKIAVPTEILAKPGNLFDEEFALIKRHPSVGYSVLKNVDFPWPVARVALEHHERMDGSGYPHGIKGEEIVFEARILAVADVLEAMASHRPYRPALGIDKALEEIERGSGVSYDPNVAEACLRLFREKGYRVPE